MDDRAPGEMQRLQDQIDPLCSQYERQRNAGESPDLEEYLRKVDGPAQGILLRELLLIECDQRPNDFPRDEYAQRFPDHLHVVNEIAASLQRQITPGNRGDLTEAYFAEGAVSNSNETTAIDLPGYEFLGELGRGGMGVVFKARHTELKRIVAVKVIISGEYAGSDEESRFLSEAEAVAALQHDNIVQVHDFGRHQSRPYMALEFVSGGSLATRLENGPLPPHEAAIIVEQLAQGMNAAHQAGIVHRDLKPANILLTAESRPKITDFGLAKRVESDGGLTHTGAIMGTPSYMSPEQAKGESKRVGPAADVYALGAVLYHCLTGIPPFQSESVLKTLEHVVNDSPTAPSRIQRDTPKDLEVICLKCLAKAPSSRYASADALAQDLRAWLNNEPIGARPVGMLERFRLRCKRRPAETIAAALLLLLIGVGGIAALFTWLWRDATHARDLLANEKRKTDAALLQVQQSEKKLAKALDREKTLNDKLDTLLYARQMALAQEHLQKQDYPAMRDVLNKCDKRMRGWEWYYLDGKCPFVRSIPLDTSRVTRLRIRPNENQLVVADFLGSVHLHSFATGKQIARIQAHENAVSGIEFDRDGKRMVTISGNDPKILIWDLRTYRIVRSLQGHLAGVVLVQFSPDGKMLASMSRHASDKTVRIWDVQLGKQRFSFPNHPRATALRFSHDGRMLACLASNNPLKFWDTKTGKEVLATKDKDDRFKKTTFIPISGTSASLQGNVLSISDTKTGVTLLEAPHSGIVRDFALHRLENRAVTCLDGSRTVFVWRLTNDGCHTIAKKEHRLARASMNRGHGPLHAIVVGKNSRRIDVWNIASGKPIQTVRLQMRPTRCTLGPSGKKLLCATSFRRQFATKIVDLAGDVGETSLRDAGIVYDACFSTDGRLLATVGAEWSKEFEEKKKWPPWNYGKTIRVWDTNSGNELFSIARKGLLRRVCFAPNDKTLVTGGVDGKINIWDSRTGRSIAVLDDGAETRDICFSPRGNYIAAANRAGTVRVYDAHRTKVVFSWTEKRGMTTCVRFSPDGTRLLCTGRNSVRLYELLLGQQILTIPGHFLEGRFSPDGARLVLIGPDGAELHQPLGAPKFRATR